MDQEVNTESPACGTAANNLNDVVQAIPEIELKEYTEGSSVINGVDGIVLTEAVLKKCIDCKELKLLDLFQRTPKGGRAKDCKVCRRIKYEKGVAAKADDGKEVTKDWIIKEAKKLYLAAEKNHDRIRLLDTISRNINDDTRNVLDDTKVIRDLIASRKKLAVPEKPKGAVV